MVVAKSPPLRAQQEEEPAVPAYGWAYGWVVLVVAAYMFQRGARGDYVLPAYTAGGVLVVAMLDRARRRADAIRVAAHLILGAVGLLGLACPILTWVASRRGAIVWPRAIAGSPLLTEHMLHVESGGGWLEPGVMALAALIAAVAGGITLLSIHRRRYLTGGFAACVVMAGVAGLYQGGWSAAARSRAGDQLHQLVNAARDVSQRKGLPLVCYQVGYTPVQAMLDTNLPMDQRAWKGVRASMTARADHATSAASGGRRKGGASVVLLTSTKAWHRAAPRLGQGRSSQVRVLMATPKLPESHVSLLLMRLDSLN